MTRTEFIHIVSGEQEQLRRFLLALCCGNRDEADDIAQEALVKAYLSSSRYQEQGNFSAWIYKIAYNTFLDYKKRLRPISTLDSCHRVVSNMTADKSFQYQELYCALDALPDKERTVILLFYIKGYSTKEISQIIECSNDAVKMQLSRGRQHLRHLLKDNV